MRKKASLLAALFMAGTLIMGTLPVSAATGTDVVETFESYRNNALLAGGWFAEKDSEAALTLSLDETTSAPNRGDGAKPGNYRSMKVAYDTSKNDGWAFFRGAAEDGDPLKNVSEGKGKVYFSFWAKADKKTDIRFSLNLQDKPFGYEMSIGTQWKEYKIEIGDFKASDTFGDIKQGESPYQVTKAGKWGYETKYAFLVGYRIDFTQADASGNVWFDTMAFTGEGITERRKVGNGPLGDSPNDTEADRDGTVPRGFVPDDDDDKPDPPSTATTPPVNSGAPAPPPDKTTATAGGGSPTTGATDVSSQAAGSSTTETREGPTAASSGGTVPADTSSPPENGGGAAGIIVAAVIIVLAGAGAAFYFLYWKKKHAGGGADTPQE